MERSGCGYRIYKWGRESRTSIVNILGGQEDTPLIQEIEHVARPIPIYETEGNLINMKNYLGIVIQAADENGDVLDDCVLYGAILSSMACNDEWMATGETNKHGIFHVHGLIKASVRSDSWRRTLQTTWKSMHTHAAFIERWGAGCTIDMMKCQKAHKPSSLMEYICKNPSWCITNSNRLGQRAYDIGIWNLAERFKHETEKQPDIDQGNPMTQEIIRAIQESGAKNIEELMRNRPEMIVKHLHKPGLQTIVQNCFTFVKCLGSTWSIKNYERFSPDPSGIHGVLLTQGLSPDDFDPIFLKWITKTDPKRNTICIIGPSNTGKTSFVRGLRAVCPAGEVCNGANFNFEDLVERYWGFWDEPLCGPEQADKFKQIAGGEPCVVPIKFKRPAHLPRIPMWISTNHPIWKWCPHEEQMFRNRMWIFKFKYNLSDGRFIPRTSQSSCQCRYCRQLGGGQASTSQQSIERMYSEKRSESTGQLMASRDDQPKATVGSRSVRKRTGGSGESAGTSSGESGSSAAKSRRSASSTASTSTGSSTKYGSSSTSIGVCGSGTRSSQSLGHSESGGCSGNDSRRVSSSESSGADRRGLDGDRIDLQCYEELDPMVPMGGSGRSELEMEILTEQSRLVEQVGTIESPTMEHWERYLAAIWERYKDIVIRKKTEGFAAYPVDVSVDISDTEDE